MPNRFPQKQVRSLDLPSPQVQTYPAKPTLHILALVVFSALITSIAITGCLHEDADTSNDSSSSVLATKLPVSTNSPAVESPTPSATTVSHPTQTIAPTVMELMTQTPYPTSTPYPTAIPTGVAVFTPTPTPVKPAEPAPTPVPTPVRPAVSGYLLMVNGTYTLPNEVSIPIENGYVMVSPIANEDGSYPFGTEVTLGYYPDRSGDVASWTGVDSVRGEIAKLIMDRDREVIATIGP